MVRFFTSVLGLKNVCFDFAVVNPYNYDECISWLKKCRDVVREVIVDTAVHKLFAEKNLVDYPSWYINRYVAFVQHVTSIVRNARILYVIPDIPVDYDGREQLYPYNVERTVQYIELFLDKYVDYLKPAVPIPVIQGKKDSVNSILDTYYAHEDLYRQFEIVGVGPTCTTRNYSRLYKLLLAVERNVCKPYHSFGAHLKAIELLLRWKPRFFYSFDSTAYHWLGRHRVATPQERLESLQRYITKLRALGVETPGIVVLKQL